MNNPPISSGLRANWRQFALLAVINAFGGARVGLERTIVPLIAKNEFGIKSSLIVLSFLISFGVTKSLTNLLAGRLSEQLGRKKILVAGWVVGLAVPARSQPTLPYWPRYPMWLTQTGAPHELKPDRRSLLLSDF
jgi:MFS family permease